MLQACSAGPEDVADDFLTKLYAGKTVEAFEHYSSELPANVILKTMMVPLLLANGDFGEKNKRCGGISTIETKAYYLTNTYARTVSIINWKGKCAPFQTKLNVARIKGKWILDGTI
jgi:hypothetical protein